MRHLRILLAVLLLPALWAVQPVRAAGPTALDAVIDQVKRAMLQAQYDGARALIAEAKRRHQAPCDRARLEVAQARLDVEEGSFRGGRDPLASATAAVESARKCGQARVVADAVDTEGRVHYQRSLAGTEPGFEAALRLFTRALELRREAKAPPDEIAESLFRVGLVHEQQQDLVPAESYYREALTHALRAANDLMLSYLYRHLASFERREKGPEGELAFHRLSLELREKAGFRAGVVFARIAVGETLFGMGRADEAAAEWERARDDAARAGITRGQTMANQLLEDAQKKRTP